MEAVKTTWAPAGTVVGLVCRVSSVVFWPILHAVRRTSMEVTDSCWILCPAPFDTTTFVIAFLRSRFVFVFGTGGNRCRWDWRHFARPTPELASSEDIPFPSLLK